MNWIREIVSGKKQRFKDGGYNLDLTYVTPRIIAMSFPAAGLESTFRNNIDDVAALIKGKHKTNYLIFNLSGRKYDYLKFDGLVVEYPWEDHHSPPLHFLFQICQDIHKFLSSINIPRAQSISPKLYSIEPKGESAVAVHCLAGKGRTGTVICCYFLYAGAFKTAEDALLYYKRKRFSTGGGVTQPSQVRYVKYFERLLFGEPLQAKGYFLNNIICYGINDLESLKPQINIFAVKKTKDVQDDQMLFPNRSFYGDQRSFIELDAERKRLIFQAPPELFVSGDILVRIYDQSMFGTKLLFRFAINVAFVKEGQFKPEPTKLTIHDMDPDKTAKDSRYSQDFYLTLSFNRVDVSDKSIVEDVKEEQRFMDIIDEILKQYKRPDPEQSAVLLFGDPRENDIAAVLKQKDYEVTKSVIKDQKADIEDEDEEDERLKKEIDSKNRKKEIQEDEPEAKLFK